MRRIAQALAVTGVVAGLGITAFPAAWPATAHPRAAAQARSARASHMPTPAQRKAIARARRLLALRNQRGTITGLVRRPNGAPAANVCVVASNAIATQRAYTRPDGRFVITGLPRGAYRVEYRGCSPIGKFVGQWYGGLTRKTAKPVLVAGSSPVQLAPVRLGIISPRFTKAASATRQLSPVMQADKQLRRLVFGHPVQAPARATNVSHVSGKVTTKAGHPLAGVCV